MYHKLFAHDYKEKPHFSCLPYETNLFYFFSQDVFQIVTFSRRYSSLQLINLLCKYIALGVNTVYVNSFSNKTLYRTVLITVEQKETN